MAKTSKRSPSKLKVPYPSPPITPIRRSSQRLRERLQLSLPCEAENALGIPSTSRIQRDGTGSQHEAKPAPTPSLASTSPWEFATGLVEIALPHLRRGEANDAQDSEEDTGRNPQENAMIVKEIGKILERHGKCIMCGTSADVPYQLACGHLFCVACLRQWLEKSLHKKLRKLKRYRHHTEHDLDECQSIPISEFQQMRLIECIEFHKLKPSDFFKYECPRSKCRRSFCTVPTRNIALGSLLEDVQSAVQGRKVQSSVPNPNQPNLPFEGLFLTTKLRARLLPIM